MQAEAQIEARMAKSEPRLLGLNLEEESSDLFAGKWLRTTATMNDEDWPTSASPFVLLLAVFCPGSSLSDRSRPGLERSPPRLASGPKA